MGHTSSTLRTLLILGTITVAVAVGYYLFFAEIRATNRMASLLANEIDVTTQGEAELRNLREVVENTRSDRNRLDSFFIIGNDIVDFLEVIEGLEESTGAEINVRSIGEKTGDTAGFSEELALSVISTGTWEEVYHFFTLLESLPYRIHMNQVQLSLAGFSEDEVSEWLGSFSFVITKMK